MIWPPGLTFPKLGFTPTLHCSPFVPRLALPPPLLFLRWMKDCNLAKLKMAGVWGCILRRICLPAFIMLPAIGFRPSLVCSKKASRLSRKEQSAESVLVHMATTILFSPWGPFLLDMVLNLREAGKSHRLRMFRFIIWSLLFSTLRVHQIMVPPLSPTLFFYLIHDSLLARTNIWLRS